MGPASRAPLSHFAPLSTETQTHRIAIKREETIGDKKEEKHIDFVFHLAFFTLCKMIHG